MTKISELDRRIVEILAKDARRSNRSIAKEIGISDSHVRKRLLNLQKTGAIRVGSVSAVSSLGLNFGGEVMLSVKPNGILEFVKAVSKLECVTMFATTTGRYNVLLSVTVSDISEFEHVMATQILVHPSVLESAHRIVKTVYKHRSDIAAVRDRK